MMTTNWFVIANVKHLRTYAVLNFYCLFSRTSWCVGVLNSAIFLTAFTIWLSLARFFGGPSEFRGGGFEHPKLPLPRYATVRVHTLSAQYCFTGAPDTYFIRLPATLYNLSNWQCHPNKTPPLSPNYIPLKGTVLSYTTSKVTDITPKSFKETTE